MPLPLPDPVDLDDLLEPFAHRGVDLSLDRLRAALAEGGHPERHFPAVQVAGTNGKGSICTFLHAILRAADLRCGTYRSPHLLSWCERLQLDDAWITPAQLREDLGRWRPIGARHALTPFELLTAAAFDRLAASGVDLAVLEVGLGGRLDATTTHPHRAVIGFGAIGLDHREHLGGTIATIAAEKAGVLSPGSIAFSAPQHPEAAAVLAAEAERRGAKLHWLEPLPAAAAGGPALGLAGDLQRANAAVATAMAGALAERGWPIPREAITAGLDLLNASAPAGPAPRRWLLAIQAHKQGAEMLTALLRPGDQAAIVPVPDHASWSAAALALACPALAGQLTPLDSVAEGLAWLLAAEPGPAVASGVPVVAGSLYLLGAVLPRLDPPTDSPAPDSGR